MNINETMRELAQYTRLQEEAAAMVTSSRIDTAALKKGHPDIATQYTKTTETKRFTFA